MNSQLKPAERRSFIGGSDARTIMGTDESALIRPRRRSGRGRRDGGTC